MHRLDKVLTRLSEGVITTATILMVAFVFIQILFRYLVSYTLPWSEEYARYLMITATFFGAALASLQRSHIQVEIRHLFNFSPRISALQDMIVDLLGVFVAGLLAVLFYPVCVSSYERGHLSPSEGVLLVVPYGLLWLGLVFMALNHSLCVFKGLKRILRKEE